MQRRLTSIGVHFDPWQQGLSTITLGCREDGKYAASVGGVVASIPRQVGKTFTFGNLLIGLCLEFPGLRAIWTSHHNRTTTNTFRSMQAMVQRKKVLPHLAPNGIRTANGEQEIRFKNGSIIMFGAREQGFGRGMDAIDIEVFDEAQILSIKALEDMVPATNQAKHPHGGLIIFIGTPPRPSDEGEAFTAKRTKALAGKTTDQVYVELSADPESKPDDRSQWPVMNPSYPHRTPLEAMLRMRENIPDDDSWDREARGIWPIDAGREIVFDLDKFGDLANLEPELVGSIALALDRSLDGSTWVLGAAQATTEGRTHVEVGFCGSATLNEMVAMIVQVVAAWDPVVLVIDRKSGANVLEQLLINQGIEPEFTNAPQMASACLGFEDDAGADQLSYTGQECIDDALRTAEKRYMPQGDFAWEKKVGPEAIPLTTLSLARWGLLTFGIGPKPGPAAAPAFSESSDPDLSGLDVFEASF
ncbi:MAG: terminase [Gordonia sp. (in: high G+C Gram-positive bacteria)]|nr:MAG: terminase [Gordonia sp. (in: high G+C Gram-positive bacteria)]